MEKKLCFVVCETEEDSDHVDINEDVFSIFEKHLGEDWEDAWDIHDIWAEDGGEYMYVKKMLKKYQFWGDSKKDNVAFIFFGESHDMVSKYTKGIAEQSHTLFHKEE